MTVKNSQVKRFVMEIQAVLPKFELMGEVMESCGLKFKLDTIHYDPVNMRAAWQGENLTMDTSIASDDDDDIYAMLWLGDDVGNVLFLVARSNRNGEVFWDVNSMISFDDTQLHQLMKDIHQLISGTEIVISETAENCTFSLDVPDDGKAREIASMMAVEFKRVYIEE